MVLSLLAAGCTESSVKQYTELGEWTHPPSRPRVLSGDPQADSAAYGESARELSAADWHRLEEIAPRPIWERIKAARKALKGTSEHGAASRPALRLTAEPQDGERRPAPRDVPILPQPDGKVKIFYQLRYYGGTGVQSQYKGGTDRRSISLSSAELQPVLALVAQQLGDKGTVAPLAKRNMVVVTCPAEMQQPVLDLLDTIDQPTKQAEITARIFEVRQDFDFQIGVESVIKHLAANEEQSLVSTLNPARFLEALESGAPGGFQGSVLRLMRVFESAGVTLDATFQALANTGLIKVVASPRMTVASGETAYMLAGREIPIQSGRISGDNFVTEKVTYKPVGVQLYITPKAICGGVVKLHMITIVSTVEGFAPRRTVNSLQDTEPVVNPIINSREAETSVTVDDGDTLVVGGLRMVRKITREEKLPGLGDIWGIEWLFKKHRSQKEMSDLYFFVTPRLVSR
jgi:type II secretory pathway component GspD/PulD (secretin)